MRRTNFVPVITVGAYLFFGFFFTYISGIHGFIVPDEIPTVLSVIYSNIPSIKLGTDSRLGWGFRFGDRADAQVLLELGPQTHTQRLANEPRSDNEDENTFAISSSSSESTEETKTDAPFEVEEITTTEEVSSKSIILQNKYQQETESTFTDQGLKALNDLSIQIMNHIFEENKIPSDELDSSDIRIMLDIISQIDGLKKMKLEQKIAETYKSTYARAFKNIFDEAKHRNFTSNKNEIDVKVLNFADNSTVAVSKEEKVQQMELRHLQKDAITGMNVKIYKITKNDDDERKVSNITTISNNIASSKNNIGQNLMIQVIPKLRLDSENTNENPRSDVNQTMTASETGEKITTNQFNKNDTMNINVFNLMAMAIEEYKNSQRKYSNSVASNETKKKVSKHSKNNSGSLVDLVDEFISEFREMKERETNKNQINVTNKVAPRIEETMNLKNISIDIKKPSGENGVKALNISNTNGIIDTGINKNLIPMEKFSNGTYLDISKELMKDLLKKENDSQIKDPVEEFEIDRTNMLHGYALHLNENMMKYMENGNNKLEESKIMYNFNLTHSEIVAVDNLLLQLISKIKRKEENKENENKIEKLMFLLTIIRQEHKNNQKQFKQDTVTSPNLMNIESLVLKQKITDKNKTNEHKMTAMNQMYSQLYSLEKVEEERGQKIITNFSDHNESEYRMQRNNQTYNENEPLENLMNQLIIKLIEKRNYQGEEQEIERKNIVKALVSVYQALEDKKKKSFINEKYLQSTIGNSSHISTPQLIRGNKLEPTDATLSEENMIIRKLGPNYSIINSQRNSEVFLSDPKIVGEMIEQKTDVANYSQIPEHMEDKNSTNTEIEENVEDFNKMNETLPRNNDVEKLSNDQEAVDKFEKSNGTLTLYEIVTHSKTFNSSSGNPRIDETHFELVNSKMSENSFSPMLKNLISQKNGTSHFSINKTNNMLRHLNMLLTLESTSKVENSGKLKSEMKKQNLLNQLVSRLIQMMSKQVKNLLDSHKFSSAILTLTNHTNKPANVESCNSNRLKEGCAFKKNIPNQKIESNGSNQIQRFKSGGKSIKKLERYGDVITNEQFLRQQQFPYRNNRQLYDDNAQISRKRIYEHENQKSVERIEKEATAGLNRTVSDISGTLKKAKTELNSNVNSSDAEKYLRNSISQLSVATKDKKKEINKLMTTTIRSYDEYLGRNPVTQLAAVSDKQGKSEKGLYNAVQKPQEVTSIWLQKWSEEFNVNKKPDKAQ